MTSSFLSRVLRATGPSARSLSSCTRWSNSLTVTFRPRSFISRGYASAAAVEEKSQSILVTEEEEPPKSFSSLTGAVSKPLLQAIVDRPFKLKNMTPVQQEVLSLLPEIADSYDPEKQQSTRDLLVRAKTGTGKTLAFLVPAIEARLRSVEEAGKKAVRDAGLVDDALLESRAQRKYSRETVGTLIISPTRELATQIANEAIRLSSHLNGKIEVRLLTGGTNKRLQMRDWMKGNRDIVVATTGRLRDLLSSEPDVKRGIATTHQLILDEADTLLDMGFRDDIEAIKDHIPPSPERQTFLFSATVSPQVRQVARSILGKDYKYIDCVKTEDSPVHAHIPQYHTVVPSAAQQLPHILRLIAHDQLVNAGKSKIILFCPTTRMTQLYTTILRSVGRRLLPAGRETNILEIHSKRKQESRTATSDMFRADKSGATILVTSDVSARGVDYPNVSRVIQVGIPSSTDQYVHRVGRTGRGRESVAGRADLVLLPWEIGFVTWQLTDIPLKPLTNSELQSQLTELVQKYDESPNSIWQDIPSYAKHVRYQHPYSHLIEETDNIRDRLSSLLEEDAVRETMLSLIGYYFGKSAELRVQKNVIFEGCKSWSVEAMGLDTPPFVSEAFLAKLGMMGDDRAPHYGQKRSATPYNRSGSRQHWQGRGQQRLKNRVSYDSNQGADFPSVAKRQFRRDDYSLDRSTRRERNSDESWEGRRRSPPKEWRDQYSERRRGSSGREWRNSGAGED
ncbi:DEAD-domain-containing protein [Dendrothele bispora CBS 962.96]|uniref:ATP-dependent RNA helicase n=1 Tax=Dendrothele bispora (strain CBS 962.96) TaxID=1314807 RepID=A0A4S8MKN6_DENBC|nr:DEAD-domain-containing protein [Dendrothele bispora CBS 962.96]